MKNIEIAWVFNEIADLLELQGENPFKVRAYRKGARALELLSESVEEMVASGRLQTVEGIGEALAKKITEYLDTGAISYHQRLLSETPAGLVEIARVPGVGPKLASRLFNELGVSSIDELEAACQGRKVRTLRGLGPRTEWNILRGINTLRSQGGHILLGVAFPLAQDLAAQVSNFPGVVRVGVAGSVRRRKEIVKDIDFVAAAHQPSQVTRLFAQMPSVEEVTAQGDTKVTAKLRVGVQVDLRVVEPGQYYTALNHFTGSKEHNVRLRQIAKEKGLRINEYGVFDLKGEPAASVDSEEALYKLLGLQYIPPEMREDRGEIELAQRGEIPTLVCPEDWKGDLHCHSNYSDGVNSLAELAEHARRLGYSYLAICDHSRSLTVAGGLSLEELLEQGERIRELNEQWEDFRLLRGIETDILSDGSLDYPDEVLAQMDIVVASIHTGFKQPKDKLTGRILAAMENPHVDIIAHPTGRLLGRRDPYEVDMEQVIEKAAQTQTILEINSSPDRLDMSDIHARWAREAGVKIAVNTDAHSLDQFEYRILGLGVARRAWLEAGQVVNTWSCGELMQFLAEKSRARV